MNPIIITENLEKNKLTYIEEDNITVGVSIVPINTVESLRELYIAYFLS